MTTNIWGSDSTEFFYDLNPDEVLKAVEVLGYRTTGRVMAMNSMENRVYEVEIESTSDNPSDHSVIIKFYRPGRWSKQQIQEEHEFLLDLTEFEVPVVAPFLINNQTLFENTDTKLFYTLFPKRAGRAPDEFTLEEIEQVGRLLGRLHNVGSMKKAQHRLELTPEIYLKSNLDYLLDHKIIPSHLELIYKNLLEQIYSLTKNSFDNVTKIRLHGDCHLGNILKRGESFQLIDFDDMITGPAIQDMWLLLPGKDEYAENLRRHLLEGYTQMREFNYEELKLTEVCRTLRMINYSAWIARRFDDPAFKNAFTFFADPSYWEIQINDLREQAFLIQNSQVIYYDDY